MCRDGFTSGFVDYVKFKRDKRMNEILAGGIALYRGGGYEYIHTQINFLYGCSFQQLTRAPLHLN